MNLLKSEAMHQAICESKFNKVNNYKNGGPFGAVIVCDNKIIASCHNTVVESKDATAHAEINAIREASKVLNTHDLSGCILYTSTEPCPMCLSAIIWANIKEIYFANTREDANNIGFRDNKIYEYFEGKTKDAIKINHIPYKEALEVLKENQEIKDREMY